MDHAIRYERSRRFTQLCASSLACCALLLSSPGWAEEKAAEKAKEDKIVTDRPDFVESSDTVGKGRFQIEASVAYERNNLDGVKDRKWSTPFLLRYGVTEDWELRLETDGHISARTEDSATGIAVSESGFADTSLGLKWHALDAAGNAPSIGFLFHLDFASGSSAFRGNGVRPSVRMSAEWELPNEMSLGIMPGIMFDKTATGERFTSGIFGVVLGKNWTDNFRSFVEIATPQIASSKYGGTVATFDVGMSYLLSKTTQVDTAISRGLNKNTPNWAWTLGFSAKF
ncbi:MAG: transporter [Burkholderiales bacterium]|nr:transporter [Burkholderiales bacterium]